VVDESRSPVFWFVVPGLLLLAAAGIAAYYLYGIGAKKKNLGSG